MDPSAKEDSAPRPGFASRSVSLQLCYWGRSPSPSQYTQSVVAQVTVLVTVPVIVPSYKWLLTVMNIVVFFLIFFFILKEVKLNAA